MQSIKTSEHFEVVQVVSRTPEGYLASYYPGDEKLASEKEARALAVMRRKADPEEEFAVVRITTAELP